LIQSRLKIIRAVFLIYFSECPDSFFPFSFNPILAQTACIVNQNEEKAMRKIKSWVKIIKPKQPAKQTCNYANNYYGDQVCR